MEFSSILHTRVANQQQFGLCKDKRYLEIPVYHFGAIHPK